MAERLSFDEKINRLASFHEQLGKLSLGESPEAIELVGYETARSIPKDLGHMRDLTAWHVRDHSREEYGVRGFTERDLRTADDVELQERAGILALASGAQSPEEFYATTARIKEFFEHVVRGDEIFIQGIGHESSTPPLSSLRDHHTFCVDTSRELFTVFQRVPGGYLFEVRYDQATDFGPQADPTEIAVLVDSRNGFREGAISYPSAP